MLNKLKKLQQQKSNEGFTIIEVMIVLAIAGLIILIVLLAVPALQRNGRNTAIKNDANSVIGYVSDFNANNDGAKPTGITVANGLVTISSTVTGTTPATGKIQTGTTGTASAASATAVTPTAGDLQIRIGAKCPDTISGTSVTFAATDLNARAVAVVYAIETQSALSAKCIST